MSLPVQNSFYILNFNIYFNNNKKFNIVEMLSNQNETAFLPSRDVIFFLFFKGLVVIITIIC